jgi:hypothetical protein
MIRERRFGILPPILAALTALIALSGGAFGVEPDAVGAKQAAVELSKAAASIRARIGDLEPGPILPEGQRHISTLKRSLITLCLMSDLLVEDTRTYFLTRSFLDLPTCEETLAECYMWLLDLRRETCKLPAKARKGLLKDVMSSFRKVDLALYGGMEGTRFPMIPYSMSRRCRLIASNFTLAISNSGPGAPGLPSPPQRLGRSLALSRTRSGVVLLDGLSAWRAAYQKLYIMSAQ